MLINVTYIKTIDESMKIFKIECNEEDEDFGFVCSYKSKYEDYHSNGFIIINGKLRGLYHNSEQETLQECLEHLVRIMSPFYGDVELIYNGETFTGEDDSFCDRDGIPMNENFDYIDSPDMIDWFNLE